MAVVGVVGAGTMGRGIAETAITCGFDVVLIDTSLEIASKGYSAIQRNLQRAAEKGRIPPDKIDEILSRLTIGADLSLLKDVFLLIEAVYEDMETKKTVLHSVSEIVADTAIIGSNTSSLSISRMAASVKEPGRFLGIHFFNPVPVMRLVELIPCTMTAAETVEKAKEFCQALGKTCVVVRESPGFIVNRLLCPMMNEAAYLVMEGIAVPEDIDTAMKLGANHPIGPLALADLVGIDVLLAIMETLYAEFADEKYRPCPLLREMVHRGHLGRKSGQGFFKY